MDTAHYEIEIASNRNTPGWVLEKLYLKGYTRSNDIRSLIAIAHNPNTPAKILEKLAADKKNYVVRVAVAQNDKTPKDILKEFAADDLDVIRYFAIINENSDKEIEEIAINTERLQEYLK